MRRTGCFNDPESEHTRHVIWRADVGHTFLGSVYGLSLSDSWKVVTVGIEACSRPICATDAWLSDITTVSVISFDFVEDYTASYINIEDTALASQLESTFTDLHDFYFEGMSAVNSFMITFRGYEQSSRFVFKITAFEFHRNSIEDGYKLVIRQVNEPFNGSFAVWQHRPSQRDHRLESVEDYHTNLLRRPREAKDNAGQENDRR